jgi:hypothetical protein
MSFHRPFAGMLFLPALLFPAAPEFHKDVLPVLQKNCQSCHRPGEVGPMAFTTYQETRPWAKAIRQAVVTGKMPPWSADNSVTHYRNNRALSQAEIGILKAWADAGAPEGNPAGAPPPPTWVEGWTIPKPHRVIQLPEPFKVPAKGTVEYTYYRFPEPFKEDTWVTAAEIRPEAREHVHHIIAFIRPPGSPWLKNAPAGEFFVPPLEGRDNPPAGVAVGDWREFLVGYVPGYRGMILDPGHGKLIRAGSELILEIHYTTNGTPVEDRSKLGLIFASEPPARRVLTVAAMNPTFTIPPGADNHEVKAALTLNQEVTLLTMNPHMHLRGKAFEYKVTYPSGETELLLRVPKYDFNWQINYELAEPRVLPPGTSLECTAWFDNSPNNPYNPDPKTEVRWGDQSWEEMMAGFIEIAFDRTIDRNKLFRRPPPPRTESASTQ